MSVLADPQTEARASEPAVVTVPRRRRRAGIGWLDPRVWAPPLVLLAVLAVAWTAIAQRMPFLLPPLSAVGASLADDPVFYLENAGITIAESIGGLAIGFAAAFVLAVVMSELAIVRRAVMPFAVVLNVTPLVAIAPALVVAFGFGPAPKLIITALICFFPILINTATGLRSVPQQVVQVYQTVRASRIEMLLLVRIPHALPLIFAALKIVFPLSVIGAVVAELSAAGATGGLGTVISGASSMNRLDVVYAAIVVLALMGVALLGVVTLIERRLLRWRTTTSG